MRRQTRTRIGKADGCCTLNKQQRRRVANIQSHLTPAPPPPPPVVVQSNLPAVREPGMSTAVSMPTTSTKGAASQSAVASSDVIVDQIFERIIKPYIFNKWQFQGELEIMSIKQGFLAELKQSLRFHALIF